MAPSLELLIAFRVVQGIGAAMVAPASLAIVLDSFPAEQRAAGVGIWGAAAAAAAAVGPTLGGALVELADWRLVFLVNLPLGAAVAGRRPRLLSSGRPPTAACPTCRARRCWRSAWRWSRSAIVEGNDWGWTRGADARLLRRRPRCCSRARRHPQPQPPRPIVEPELFAHRSFRAATSAPCSSPPPSSR